MKSVAEGVAEKLTESVKKSAKADREAQSDDCEMAGDAICLDMVTY